MNEHHCKDCCCARSWAALGVADYTGKSIPEYITEIRAENKRLLNAYENMRDFAEANGLNTAVSNFDSNPKP